MIIMIIISIFNQAEATTTLTISPTKANPSFTCTSTNSSDCQNVIPSIPLDNTATVGIIIFIAAIISIIVVVINKKRNN